MSFLDQLGKTLSHGMDRAKFEAEKFQKTNRIQGELNHLKRQLDDKLIELGQRAYDLQRAGQINAPSVAALSQVIDRLRADVIVQEEALKALQAEVYEEPTGANPPPPVPAQSIPISPAPPAQTAPPPAQAAPGTKTCPACNFNMPMHAVFCPNCGYRVGK